MNNMNGFAYWNDIYFSNSYSKFHGSDNSLVCSNNILYYKGLTTPIVGNYLIKKNECVDLSSFKVSSIDNQVWSLEPHELFFWIRETVCLNNLSNEELNSRLNQFANLFKTLKNLFKGVIQMPPSANIFINFGNSNNTGSFHENKIIQLEKFLKDLSEINILNTSRPFRKFLEFEQYVDEENDLIVNVNQKSIRRNKIKNGDALENNGDKSDDDSL
jgi:hypothetical protein